MLLYPKRAKHRKWQTRRKNSNKIRIASRINKVSLGEYGLKSLDEKRINSNQIESARKILRRTVGKTGKIWIRVFPDRPFTKKPAEVGMGKGKGAPEGFCAEILPGTIIFEAIGDKKAVEEGLRKAGTKLPVRTKIVQRLEI